MKLNHHLLFTILFLFSVFKPFSGEFTIYSSLGICFLILLLFSIILFNKTNREKIWESYKKEIILFIFLGISFSISAVLNWTNYPSLFSIILYSGSALLVMALLPISYIIFSPYLANFPKEYFSTSFKNHFWVGIATLILLHLLGVLFFFVGEKMQPIYSYTLARDVFTYKTKSILNHHTTYGVSAALSIIFCSALLLQYFRLNKLKIFIGFTVFLAFCGGILSTSRNFYWTLGIGLIVFCIQRLRTKKQLALILSAGTLITFIFVPITLKIPTIGNNFEPIFPYIQKWEQKSSISCKDFLPKLNNVNLGKRAKLWSQAVNFWQENKWIGIGPGSFRIRSSFKEELNVHNIYLQMLVEGGVVALTTFILLILNFIWRLRNSPALPLLIALLASLIFDNFLDYSIPFVLCCGYMFAVINELTLRECIK